MRTFVKLRQWALDSKEFGQRLLDLEKYFMEHCKDNETLKIQENRNVGWGFTPTKI